MEVTRSRYNKKILYGLTLSRKEFNDLCCGNFVGGKSSGGFKFYLLPRVSDEISRSFKPYAGKVGHEYFACVSASSPTLPQGADSETVNRLAQQSWDNLEKAINESGIIPIEEPTIKGDPSGNFIAGYVTMKVKKIA